MIYYDKIDVSEGKNVMFVTIGISQTIYSFKFQPDVCNRCHDLLMSVNLSDIAI